MLASYGSFIETDPDLLHDTWDIWQLAGLRLSVCTVSRKGDRLALECLDRIVGTKFDLLVGASGLDAKPVWFRIPELAEIATLRLIGAFPSDLTVVDVHLPGQRRAIVAGNQCP